MKFGELRRLERNNWSAHVGFGSSQWIRQDCTFSLFAEQSEKRKTQTATPQAEKAFTFICRDFSFFSESPANLLLYFPLAFWFLLLNERYESSAPLAAHLICQLQMEPCREVNVLARSFM
jgi:hypothetical protein